eukprot:4719396-Pleurochrysis_carterae.AAC.6
MRQRSCAPDPSVRCASLCEKSCCVVAWALPTELDRAGSDVGDHEHVTTKLGSRLVVRVKTLREKPLPTQLPPTAEPRQTGLQLPGLADQSVCCNLSTYPRRSRFRRRSARAAAPPKQRRAALTEKETPSPDSPVPLRPRSLPNARLSSGCFALPALSSLPYFDSLLSLPSGTARSQQQLDLVELRKAILFCSSSLRGEQLSADADLELHMLSVSMSSAAEFSLQCFILHRLTFRPGCSEWCLEGAVLISKCRLHAGIPRRPDRGRNSAAFGGQPGLFSCRRAQLSASAAFSRQSKRR